MRLVWIKAGIYDVLAIADRKGEGVLEQVEDVTSGDPGAVDMRALLEDVIPTEGPLSDRVRSRPLGDGLFEFKTWGVRALWFYAGKLPGVSRGIVCVSWSRKQPKKAFRDNEEKIARRSMRAFEDAKRTGTLIIPPRPRRRR